VVFDIAGTTVEDEIGVMRAFQSTVKKFGYDIPVEDIAPVMGYKKIEAITILLDQYENDKAKITGELINEMHQAFVDHMIKHYQTSPDIAAFPHSEVTFVKLHQLGIKVGLNTGFTRAIADTIMDRLQWQKKGLVDYLIASDEVEKGRPYPYMIKQMMAKFGITDPAEVAKVGDTEVDIREGQNVGCKYIIGVTTGSFTRQQLEPYNPTHIIDDIADVIGIVTQ